MILFEERIKTLESELVVLANLFNSDSNMSIPTQDDIHNVVEIIFNELDDLENTIKSIKNALNLVENMLTLSGMSETE